MCVAGVVLSAVNTARKTNSPPAAFLLVGGLREAWEAVNKICNNSNKKNRASSRVLRRKGKQEKGTQSVRWGLSLLRCLW